MTDTLTIHTEAGPLELPAGATLADALRRLLPGDEAEQAEAATRLATAVNGDFVPRNQRASHALRDGDTVLCFAPITGG